MKKRYKSARQIDSGIELEKIRSGPKNGLGYFCQSSSPDWQKKENLSVLGVSVVNYYRRVNIGEKEDRHTH